MFVCQRDSPYEGHKRPPLDTPQLAGERDTEIRVRQIGLLSVQVIRGRSLRSLTTQSQIALLASRASCDGADDVLSEPRRHTIKPQHEDQLRLELQDSAI